MSHPLLRISCVNNEVRKTKNINARNKNKTMNSSLKLFTQSDILHQIGVDSLQRVLSHFTDSDRTAMNGLKVRSECYFKFSSV
jgi:hypothetical protein